MRTHQKASKRWIENGCSLEEISKAGVLKKGTTRKVITCRTTPVITSFPPTALVRMTAEDTGGGMHPTVCNLQNHTLINPTRKLDHVYLYSFTALMMSRPKILTKNELNVYVPWPDCKLECNLCKSKKQRVFTVWLTMFPTLDTWIRCRQAKHCDVPSRINVGRDFNAPVSGQTLHLYSLGWLGGVV